MPKQPKNCTPLRQVRLASGLTQKEFAEKVGFGYELYHSLELGRIPLTEANAERVFDYTGVAPTTLDPTHSQCALAHDGKPYSQEAWRSWQRYIGNEANEWPQVRDLLEWVHFLCDVARKAGRLRSTRKALIRSVRKIASECWLRGAINEELRKTKLTTTWRFSYGDLRKNKLLADLVGFKDTHYREGRIIDDEEVWEGTVTNSAQWDPYRYCPEQVTKRLKPLR